MKRPAVNACDYMLGTRKTRHLPATMLELKARECRRARVRDNPRTARKAVRLVLATLALAIGLSGFSLSSAQAFPWDDMQESITATITNMCGPNDVPTPSTYTGVDTLAGLNAASGDSVAVRSTIMPVFSQDADGTAGGNGMDRLQDIYGPYGEVIAHPTYERYGFSALSWHQYGYDCFSPSLMMGPLADMGLTVLVHVPMMISMAILNLAMDNQIYDAFATMMQPFIGAMYQLFNPWIYMIVPVGVLIAWLASRGSIQATLKAAGWGVFILAVFLLMGSSTTTIVSKATNIVTEVSGTAACKLNAAAGDDTSGGECSTTDPIKSVNQALWYGIPYQTWHLGQVGERQAELDSEARENGEVGWGPAILNGQYVGVNIDGEIDEQGRKVISNIETWNQANYTPDSDTGKMAMWAEDETWEDVPYLANVKLMCNDVGGTADEEREPSKKTRWMYSGNDGTNNYCDTATAGTTEMVSYIQGDEFNQQFLTALAGMVGVGAVSLTVIVASMYLGVQKMLFFFLLFLAPMVLLVSALGDRKRRPFAIRFAELIGANLLKQIAAVCIVLFVAHAMASLFGSSAFSSVPWIMKPYVAVLFFIALALLAFPLKNLVKGAVQGDTSPLDKQANAPVRAAKNTVKGAAIVGAAAASGGAAIGAGGGAAVLAGAGGKAAMAGKAGVALTQAGKALGHGSKAGRALRAGGGLLRTSEAVKGARDSAAGKRAATLQAAQSLLTGAGSDKYRDQNGELLPEAPTMAQLDAQRLAQAGQADNKATTAQEAFLNSFFQGYRAENDGAHHRDDPNGPIAQRAARAQHALNRRQARADANSLDATVQTDVPDPDVGPGPTYGPGAGPDTGPGSGAKSDRDAGPGHDPSSGPDGGHPPGPLVTPDPHSSPSPATGESGRASDTTGERIDAGLVRQWYQDRAKENLNGPSFAREMEYNINTVRSEADVLSEAGISQEQVTSDPTLLLSGEAYDGGSTVQMDPFHPVTGAMNQLRFAASSGDEDAMEKAVDQASEAVAQHGVPSQISEISSVGERAEKFESIQLVGAMPDLDEMSTWQDRAEAAHTMMAAQVDMPEDYPAREAVQDYTAALSTPGVDRWTLSRLQESTIHQIGEVGDGGAPRAFTSVEPSQFDHSPAAPRDGEPLNGRGSTTEVPSPAWAQESSEDARDSWAETSAGAEPSRSTDDESSVSVDPGVEAAGQSPASANVPANGGISREDLRDAMSEGLREQGHALSTASIENAGERNRYPAGSDTPEPYESPTSGTGAVDLESPHARPRAESGSSSSSGGGGQSVESLSDEGSLIYRPERRRRRRSGLFEEPAPADKDESEE
ncbi:hypothetical protein [Nesterenkonia halobia]|uniref:TrbL/VirB6 plasmid conjugal transfer protein n=1 Tax=Nesterenkonia halobia TaxID=37922 RepID=A0ABP6RFA4_9MICC